MKESYGEDPASHADPESCTVVRKDVSFRQACLTSLYGSVKSAFLIPTPDSGFPFR